MRSGGSVASCAASAQYGRLVSQKSARVRKERPEMRRRLFLLKIWMAEVPDLRAARASIKGPTTIDAGR